MTKRPNWHEFYMSLAYLFAMRSIDPSTQVGAVVVDQENTLVSGGYNGIPRGMTLFEDDDPRWVKEEKYFYMEHGERNAIYNAANHSRSVKDCRIYTTFFPCADCARAIIQTGINEVISPKPVNPQSVQNASHDAARAMLKECGVSCWEFEGEIVTIQNRFKGITYDFLEGFPVARNEI